SDDDHFVLWTGDANDNGQPNLSELVRITFDAEAQEIWIYEAPDSLSEPDDANYALSENFSTITESLAGSASFPGEVVLQGVLQWQFEPDSIDDQAARLIRLRLTLDQETGPDIATIITAMRTADQ